MRCSFVLLIIVALLATNPAAAQSFRWPENPENLQVLPEGTKGRELGSYMRNFAGALGVRCDHCHVGEGSNLTEFDFASDEKLAKQKARVMIEMVAAINDQHLPNLDGIDPRPEPTLQVDCRTCHRKNTRPEMLDDMLRDTIARDSVDAAIEQYRELREEYYGGFTYDFSSGVLSGIGEGLSRAGESESAIRIIEFEIEMNGETSFVLFTLANTQKFAGMRDEAIATYTRGRDLAADDWKPFFQREIDKLEAQDD